MFMKVQQDLLYKISQMSVGISSSAVQSNTNILNTALVPNLEAFEPAKETYRNYIQRLENYVTMNGVDGNRTYCTKMLFNSIDAKDFDRVPALVTPMIATEQQYEDSLKLLENYLTPKRNVLVAKHIFLSRYQGEGQSVADFVATLRGDSMDCEFVSECACKSSTADVFLRVQFIREINDGEMRE
ncbi:hypothetical protein DOY81_014264 [Sarcophaga bullata]|nr:hypothetical protein DOY81_014264 [Sarcophaga bullata]